MTYHVRKPNITIEEEMTTEPLGDIDHNEIDTSLSTVRKHFDEVTNAAYHSQFAALRVKTEQGDFKRVDFMSALLRCLLTLTKTYYPYINRESEHNELQLKTQLKRDEHLHEVIEDIEKLRLKVEGIRASSETTGE